MTSRLKVPRGCFQTKRHLLTPMNLIGEGEENSSWEMSWWFLLIHSCPLSLVSPLIPELDIGVRRGHLCPPLFTQALISKWRTSEGDSFLVLLPFLTVFISEVQCTKPWNYNFSMVLSNSMSFYILGSVSVWVLAILSFFFIWTILSCPSRFCSNVTSFTKAFWLASAWSSATPCLSTS